MAIKVVVELHRIAPRSELRSGANDTRPDRKVLRSDRARPAIISAVGYDDTFEYSEDSQHRWWYERRWADGPGLCWIGLNPSTGDTTGRPRPTLRRVVERASNEGLAAVVVVNLFSWRATRPADLRATHTSGIDIVGERTDDVINESSSRSSITLVAWGAHGSILNRGDRVARVLTQPMCLGVTNQGEPRHPLYVASAVSLTAFVPRS